MTSFTMPKSCQVPVYDWLHLHRDFTGQRKNSTARTEARHGTVEVARRRDGAHLGFNKVSVMKRNVALQIRDFVLGGGFLFHVLGYGLV